MTKVSQADLIAGAIAKGVVSFPTDTVPALAVKPESAQTIFELKQRSATKPLILMGASLDDLFSYVSGTSAELTIWQQTIKQYLPGAITFILPASPNLPPAINPLNPQTVGIRIPAHKIACEILQQTGVLATTSANLSGEAPLITMTEIDRAFPTVLVLEDDNLDNSLKTGSGMPSTVVKWAENTWQVIRQGSVKLNE
ncbi:MAG: L-threonylcarbamoyladenylate synthase [Pleurocapsa sp.]